MIRTLPPAPRLSRRAFVQHSALAAGALSMPALISGCGGTPDAEPTTPGPGVDAASSFRLLTLDPGHFHAALVQKSMYPGVSPVVHVYAPEGAELRQHLARIESYNSRADDPTHWEEELHVGPDFFERMIAERPGNIVVISGNNARKAEYITRSIEAGFHVLADKPMALTPEDMAALENAFRAAEQRRVLLYDIMTERFEITNLLQRELSQVPALFGDLAKGTPEEPTIVKESVHHYSKIVSGTPLVRPAWFFDIEQQGEGIIDVTTHLVDLVQWSAFPDQALSPTDATVLQARRWATPITPAQFEQVTGQATFPDYLQKDVTDGTLNVYANGAFTYRLRDIHARVSVTWNFEAPAGTGDTHFSVMRGSRANLVIQQGEAEGFTPVLYVDRAPEVSADDHQAALTKAVADLQARYPGIAVETAGDRSKIAVPASYAVGHEAHFAQVTENFLGYVRSREMPAWEVPNMITKYATIMQAYARSR